MSRIREIHILAFLFLAIGACHQAEPEKEKPAPESGTPVTVAPVEFVDISDSIELNATSDFLLNNYVKAPTTGYLTEVKATLGDYIETGKHLFTIQTKESMVIGKSISGLDTNFRFNGTSKINATGHGYLTQLNHQEGDYVQDGELLAVINSLNSFVFLMNLPFALRNEIKLSEPANLQLPDGTLLRGKISSIMPTLDSLSQSQVVVIKVNINKLIPQDLIAKVKIAKLKKENSQTVPKSAVMADEAQVNFWVMKMLDSNTAVKVEVKKGVEWKGRVEILEPKFDKNDRILVTGNYGLPDTAHVILDKP
jgi:multidrug efflux pump subunit AcrA (membrane-fusion protein)